MKQVHIGSIREFFEDYFIAVSTKDGVQSQFIKPFKPYVCYDGFCWVTLWQFTEDLLGVELAWWNQGSDEEINLVFESDTPEDKKQLTGEQLSLLDSYFTIVSISYDKDYDSIKITVKMD